MILRDFSFVEFCRGGIRPCVGEFSEKAPLRGALKLDAIQQQHEFVNGDDWKVFLFREGRQRCILHLEGDSCVFFRHTSCVGSKIFRQMFLKCFQSVFVLFILRTNVYNL